MTTARDIIYRAFRKAGVSTKGETPDATEANDALEELNSMLGIWSNDNMLIYARTLESFSLTANDGTYTIGSGADFNTTRPMFIVSAYVRNSTTDYPVEVISDEAFARIIQKDTGSIPAWINFDNSFPTATIKLWPLPVSAYTLYLLTEKALTSIATLDTAISLPPGWEDALAYNLAVRIMSEYGQQPDAVVVNLANESKSMIQRTILRNHSMDYGVSTSGTGNILTGWS